ncbi:MAG: long-chain fatty acid--CoA ligase [Deltaproteobacteria bacterium]|nr:long-chain fatty acid--CoA ligase [Deltaproteobacteria bacterium]
MAHSSILDLFLGNAEQFPTRTAALYKKDGGYREIDWRTLADQAQALSAALVALGVAPGDRVALLSQTRLEWVVADMGILGAGATTVPIYASNLPDECQYIIENSGAVVAITEDAAQTQKIERERGRLPGLKKIIQLDGELGDPDDFVLSYAKLGALPPVAAAELGRRRAALSADSILTLIYTSGTTGRPKGVILTHDCMLYEAEAVRAIDILEETDVQLFFLPLAHSFAKVLEIAWIATHSVLAFAESMQTIRDNLREVQPTIMCGVPRVFEKFYGAIATKGTAAGGAKAALFNAAATMSSHHGEAVAKGERLPFAERLQYAALKRLVFAKVARGLKETLGGRMRGIISGGAPLSPRIAWFFRDAGVEVLEGYGLTETSAATFVNRPGHNRIGTVGPAMPGTEVRIAADGEVLVKGRGVMRGYWNNKAATDEVLKDGWFQTGDIGVLDAAGHLKITDRKKDIIVTAGGKNVAPQNIENLLKTHKLVSQVVVHGDKRKFVSAIVTLDPDALKALAVERRLGELSYAELSQKPEVYAAVQEAIDAVNTTLPSYETIKKFKILEHDFSQESGEMTPSLKVKRKVVAERYKAIFDGFYDESH